MKGTIVLRSITYVISILAATAIIFLGNTTLIKKRRIKPSGKWEIFKKISKNEILKKMQYAPGTKEYKKIEIKLKKAGIKDLTVEAYQMIRYAFPLGMYFLIIAIKYTNIVNTLNNIHNLEKVADIMKTSTMEINTDLMLLPTFGLSLVFYFVPDLMINLITKYRNTKGEKEAMMLQTYTVMMLRTKKPVKQILKSLYDRADVYKEPLEIALNSYSKDPNEALKELSIQAGHPYFEKICVALEQALNNNSEISLIYLESNRSLGREINKINRKRKTTKKNMLGLILLFLPLLALFAVGGYPWAVYALKQLDGTIV